AREPARLGTDGRAGVRADLAVDVQVVGLLKPADGALGPDAEVAVDVDAEHVLQVGDVGAVHPHSQDSVGLRAGAMGAAAGRRGVRRLGYGARVAGRDGNDRSLVCLPPGTGDDPPCPRCGTVMIWTKASWQCLACRYKEGCCG